MEKQKREFLIRSLYTAPAILTLSATPAFAQSGSSHADNDNDSDSDTETESS